MTSSDAADGRSVQLPLSSQTEDSAETASPKPEDIKGNSSRRPSRGKRRAGASEAPQVDEGYELERRVARVEFAEGALARMRTPVMVNAAAGRDVLTDIDVLSVDTDSRLRLSTGIFECKSGAGQSGEPDRLLWLAGLQQYLAADRCTLVRRTISTRGRDIAFQLGVRIIDDQALSELERAHSWLPESFAHVGGTHCAAAEGRTGKQLKGLQAIPPKLVSFLRDSCWFVESWRVVSALLTLRSCVSQQGVLPEPAGTVIASHALVGLFTAAIHDAGRLDFVPSDQLRIELGLALTVGSPTDAHVLDVLLEADRVVRDIAEDIHGKYRELGAARVDVPIPSLSEAVASEPTQVLDHYIDLVERLRTNAGVAREMLQSVELYCFEALLGGEQFSAASFDHLFTPRHQQLIEIGFRAISAIAGDEVARHLIKVPTNEIYNRRPPEVPDRHGNAD